MEPMHKSWITAAFAVACAACVEKEPSTEKVDDGYIRENLLSAAPSPRFALNADLGGKVVYIGADVDKERAVLGDRVKVTHYWKVVQPPGSEWRLFTHVNGSAGDWINVDDTKMRKGYGPDRWKAGDIVRDEQVFPILGNWKSSDAIIYVGMFKKGGQTEKDRMAIVSGPTDGKGRLRVATIPIGAAPPKADDKPFVVRRASGEIKVDGKADEADWGKAEKTPGFLVAEGGEPVGGETRARFLYDDKNLYVFVDVADKDVASSFKKHDDTLWKEDCVELFIDADGSGKGYVELQVSPRGVTFDSWFKAGRAEGGDVAWESDMKAAVVVDGTLDKRGDQDTGWTAELAIPLAAVKGRDEAMKVNLPPAIGDRWKLNVVRVEKPEKGGPTASAWAQIGIADFHATDRLKTVVFGDAEGATSGPAARPAAPTAAPKSGDPAAK
jgi:hypothetical protein